MAVVAAAEAHPGRGAPERRRQRRGRTLGGHEAAPGRWVAVFFFCKRQWLLGFQAKDSGYITTDCECRSQLFVVCLQQFIGGVVIIYVRAEVNTL